MLVRTCADHNYEKVLQVTSLNVVVVIRRRQLLTQPNKGDEMESSSVVVRRVGGHLLSECSAVCRCGGTLEYPSRWVRHLPIVCPRGWMILILLRGLQFP